MKRASFHRLVIGMVLAGSCVLVGSMIPTVNQAHGEVTGTPEQRAFQLGSVPVLREISGTLHQIDSRLARLETIAHKLQASAAVKAAATKAGDSN
jgi:hypothetical protein